MPRVTWTLKSLIAAVFATAVISWVIVAVLRRERQRHQAIEMVKENDGAIFIGSAGAQLASTPIPKSLLEGAKDRPVDHNAAYPRSVVFYESAVSGSDLLRLCDSGESLSLWIIRCPNVDMNSIFELAKCRRLDILNLTNFEVANRKWTHESITSESVDRFQRQFPSTVVVW